MDRKKANIILRIFMGIWIFLGLAILILIICKWSCMQDNMRYVVQIAVALICSVWLGAYIWKNSKPS